MTERTVEERYQHLLRLKQELGSAPSIDMLVRAVDGLLDAAVEELRPIVSYAHHLAEDAEARSDISKRSR